MDSNKRKPGLMETLSNGCLPLSLHTKRFAVGDGEASTLLLTPMSSAPQACCSQGSVSVFPWRPTPEVARRVCLVAFGGLSSTWRVVGVAWMGVI